MAKSGIHQFYLSIVVPAVITLVLFVLSLYLFILPSFEKAIMEDKKEMISELTRTALTLLDEYEKEYQNANLTREEAQNLAIKRVSEIRYGNELKDYFWIIDTIPRMIMHPYRPELIGKELKTYKDPNGKRLFVEASKLVREQKGGFIDYMWQWKDDSTQIVPKLSYVETYGTWNWIIGTGIYLDDVEAEIKNLKGRLLRISLLITTIITLILLFIVRQSLMIEKKRKKLTSELLMSRQKYKSLVDASTQGTLMILNEKIIFCNLKFSNLAGYDVNFVQKKHFNDLFSLSWNEVSSFFDDPQKTISIETVLNAADGVDKEVVLSVSKIEYAEGDGYIVIIKEVSPKEVLEKGAQKLADELQSSLLLMNQPIAHFVKTVATCRADSTIFDVANLLHRKNEQVALIQYENEIAGIVTEKDFCNRVIARNVDPKGSILQIMSSPITSINKNALLYEALVLFKKYDIEYLVAKDDSMKVVGIISCRDIFEVQQNSVSFFIRNIEKCETVDEMQKIQAKMPVLVNALVESGDKTSNITRMISSVSDAFAKRIVELGIESLGSPPCRFLFMVMGSEGRMEQTLSTDQDNAIIIEDLDQEKQKEAEVYFIELGEYICSALDRVGYRECKGNIMASNKQWNQPLSNWKKYFSGWIDNSEPQSILDASIFFDFKGIFGDLFLEKKLREFVFNKVKDQPVFFYNLAQSVSKFKPPISIFGNIVGKNSSEAEIIIDVKKILMPVVSFSRLYTLYHALNETNTLARIHQLYRSEFIPQTLYDELTLSYNYLMQLRFRFQSEAILNGEKPDNYVDVSKLTHIEIATLKKIFGEISNLQSKVSFDFKI